MCLEKAKSLNEKSLTDEAKIDVVKTLLEKRSRKHNQKEFLQLKKKVAKSLKTIQKTASYATATMSKPTNPSTQN